MVDEKTKVRVCVLYEFEQGHTPVAAHRNVCNIFGEHMLSLWQCEGLFQRFKNGDKSLEDDINSPDVSAQNMAIETQDDSDYITTKWYYVGQDGKAYGPNGSSAMLKWCYAKYFPDSVLLRTENDERFYTLFEWTDLIGNYQKLFTTNIVSMAALSGERSLNAVVPSALTSKDDLSLSTSSTESSSTAFLNQFMQQQTTIFQSLPQQQLSVMSVPFSSNLPPFPQQQMDYINRQQPTILQQRLIPQKGAISTQSYNTAVPPPALSSAVMMTPMAQQISQQFIASGAAPTVGGFVPRHPPPSSNPNLQPLLMMRAGFPPPPTAIAVISPPPPAVPSTQFLINSGGLIPSSSVNFGTSSPLGGICNSFVGNDGGILEWQQQLQK